MSVDYTFATLNATPREELENYSLRLVHRLIPEETMTELFTFESEETDSEERLQSAQFDAMLRMSAVALSEIPHAFSQSDQAQQNIKRMTRLLLWHFYAVSFRLESAISLETHCGHVETIVNDLPKEVFQWVKVLTDLLHTYASVHEKSS